MKTSTNRFSTLNSFLGLALFGLFLSAAATARAADKTTQVKVDPEIVRLSYVQGDVRFSRGDSKGPDLNKQWEVAIANLPILQNYSVATGDGRAEIEFEYGSTVYLAENSVLIFQTLTVRNGLPSTVLDLGTGTATVKVLPIPNELFDITTPTDRLRFPSASFIRVDSYLDAMALTPQENGSMNINQMAGGTVRMVKGRTIAYRNGIPIQLGGVDHSGTPADWDGWVAARVAQRETDTAAALKASGLTSFVPGLTDLYNGGTFFACAPFGTCWEPKGRSDAAPSSGTAKPSTPTGNADTAAGSFQLVAMHVTPQQVGAQQSGAAGSQTQQQGTPPIPRQTTPPGTAPAGKNQVQKPQPQAIPNYSAFYYPLGTCPYDVHLMTVTDPVTGRQILVQDPNFIDYYPWTWGLCHSGAWFIWADGELNIRSLLERGGTTRLSTGCTQVKEMCMFPRIRAT